jgi:probable addiction module antidote protein
MPISPNKESLKRFRDNPETIAKHLNKSLERKEIQPILDALRDVVFGQNVAAIARETGMRRDKLYGTFGGDVDPTLSRVLRLLWGLNIRIVALPGPSKPPAPRPKLGRPKKQGSGSERRAVSRPT